MGHILVTISHSFCCLKTEMANYVNDSSALLKIQLYKILYVSTERKKQTDVKADTRLKAIVCDDVINMLISAWCQLASFTNFSNRL